MGRVPADGYPRTRGRADAAWEEKRRRMEGARSCFKQRPAGCDIRGP
jgi:hypothetical protein